MFHDALAQPTVELVELISHASKVASQLVSQGNDFPSSLQSAGLGNWFRTGALNLGDGQVDFVALPAQRLKAGGRVGVGLFGQP